MIIDILKSPQARTRFGWKFNLSSYDLIKDYFFGAERSTRIKDYHLKGCMEGGF